jgi:hypothetical protein
VQIGSAGYTLRDGRLLLARFVARALVCLVPGENVVEFRKINCVLSVYSVPPRGGVTGVAIGIV